MADAPEDLLYTQEHLWVRIEGGCARVGITEFLADMVGRVMEVELPEEGIEADDSSDCGHLTGSKESRDIFSPLAGMVQTVNDELLEDPELVNGDPYGEGWLFVLEDIDLEAEDTLMSPEDYEYILAENEEI